MASRRLAIFPNGLEWYWTDATPNGAITPMAIGAWATWQTAGSVSVWLCTALPSTWVNVSGGGGSGVPLSNVTAMLASATIDNTLFVETWNWTTATTQKVFKLTANALTTGDILNIESTSVGLTGHLASFATATTGALGTGAVGIQGTGAHTGALLWVESATAAGDAVQINANALVGGRGLAVLSTALGLTGSLALFQSGTTGALANGAVRVNLTAAHTGAAMQVDTATLTGVGLLINANALTSGNGLSVSSSGTTLTGRLAQFQSATTGLLANGAVRVNLTGAHTGNAMQIDTATVSGSALAISGASLTTGTLASAAANALTTGTLLDLSTSSVAVNSTNGLFRVANSSSTTTGILARFQANSTAGSGMTILGSGNVGLGTTTPLAQLHNVGATVFGVVALGDFAGGGSIGAANVTVDVSTAFTIAQTTGAQVLTLASPTNAVAGRVVTVYNVGSQSFTIYGVVVTTSATPQTAAVKLGWNGSAWVAIQ